MFVCLIDSIHTINIWTHLLAKKATQGNRKSCVSTNTFWTKRLGLQLCCNNRRDRWLLSCRYDTFYFSWSSLRLGNVQDFLPTWHRWCSRTPPRRRTAGCFCARCPRPLRSVPAVQFSLPGPLDLWCLQARRTSPSCRGPWGRCLESTSLPPASWSHLSGDKKTRRQFGNKRLQIKRCKLKVKIFRKMKCQTNF